MPTASTHRQIELLGGPMDGERLEVSPACHAVVFPAWLDNVVQLTRDEHVGKCDPWKGERIKRHVYLVNGGMTKMGFERYRYAGLQG